MNKKPKKHSEKFFLYRHRLQIGYAILMVVFLSLLVFLPRIAPGGLSYSEMKSVGAASHVSIKNYDVSQIVDLPYHAIQKLSIVIFGLNLYSVKLPSIIFGTAAAFFMILLLNRWFKSDVAVVGSILTTLSTAFLFLAGSGTPIIMYVFWLSIILWSGSKIVGSNNVNPLLVLLFAFSIGFSLYTPHLCYISLAIAIAGITHPHMRFALKQLKPYQLVCCILALLISVTPLAAGIIFCHENILNLAWMPDFNLTKYAVNIVDAFAPFFSFSLAYDSIYLAPLLGLANLALIIIGGLASVGKLFTSRNTIVSLLIIYSIVISGLAPETAISIIVPVAILSAAGLESIINRWFALFPENPYAHIIGITPITIVVTMIIASSLNHFIFGYHYTPRVVKNFDNDIMIINKNIAEGDTLYLPKDAENRDFFMMLERFNGINIISDIDNPKADSIASLGNPLELKGYSLYRIITSPKSRNSDRLYIYHKDTVKQEKASEQGE